MITDEFSGTGYYGIGIVTGASAVGDSLSASGAASDSYMWRRMCGSHRPALIQHFSIQTLQTFHQIAEPGLGSFFQGHVFFCKTSLVSPWRKLKLCLVGYWFSVKSPVE